MCYDIQLKMRKILWNRRREIIVEPHQISDTSTIHVTFLMSINYLLTSLLGLLCLGRLLFSYFKHKRSVTRYPKLTLLLPLVLSTPTQRQTTKP